MTRTLVTGMTSRTASPRAPRDAFSRLLADHLDADRGLPRITTSVADYDDVIVGIASPLAPSANHAIHALRVLADAVEHGNLRAVVIDDPNAETVIAGCRSILRDPDRLTRPYFAKRPGFNLVAVKQSDTRNKSLRALEYLVEGEIPLVLWPGYEWADDYSIQQTFAHAKRVQSIDFSSAVMEMSDTALIGSVLPRVKAWIHEDFYAPYVGLEALTFPVHTGSLGERNLDYLEAWGVLQGQTRVEGWWTPTAAHAISRGALFVANGEDGARLNISSATALEDKDSRERDAAAADQKTQFEEVSWSSETLSARLSGALGRSSR